MIFKDINPQAPTHWLVIPKTRQGLTQLREARAEHASILGHMMTTIAKVALSCPPHSMPVLTPCLSCPPHSMPLLFVGRLCVCQAAEAVWAVCVAGGPPPLACSLSPSIFASTFVPVLCAYSVSVACLRLMCRTLASRHIQTGTYKLHSAIWRVSCTVLETRWQRFGQFLNDLWRHFMLDFRECMLHFRKIASEIQGKIS